MLLLQHTYSMRPLHEMDARVKLVKNHLFFVENFANSSLLPAIFA